MSHSAHINESWHTILPSHTMSYVQPIALGESFLESQVSINYRVLYVCFAMFR